VRAFAVATASGDGAGSAGCVCAKDEGGGEQDRGEECEPQEDAAEERVEWHGRDHGGSLLWVGEKTDGAIGLGGSGQRF